MHSFTKRQLAKTLIALFLGCWVIGDALKLVFEYTEVWVYFPLFPNVIDWSLMILAGVALIILGVKK